MPCDLSEALAAAAPKRRRASRPTRTTSHRASGAPRTRPGSSGVPPRLDDLVILVIEDHADSREILRQLLESLGAGTILAREGREGLLSLSERRPDVVLCDLLMPGMDGFVFISQLRSHPPWADVPVVAVTALGGDTDYRRTWEAGFDGHLTKPIEVGQLAAVVRAVIQGRRRH